jgi:hypothetical protein
MLATLLRPPQSRQDWDIWSFAHRDQHDVMRRAVMMQDNIDLPDYQLYPIDLDILQFFLNQNQQAHDDMNAVLGTASTNLLQSDFNNPAQLQAWMYLHQREHENWANALKVS